jgi:flagellar basal-body rod protein FlgG
MTDPVATITAALQADAEVVRLIGQNIANSNTAGYRRAVPTAVAPAAAGLEGTLGAGAPSIAAFTDFATGSLASTGAPFDLAIEGKGFFAVATPDGEQLTRRGDFNVSAEGNLVTQLGDAVLGQRGPIAVSGGRFEVASDGTVSIDGAAVDRLRVLEVAADTQLEASGRGTFALPAGGVGHEDGASTIRQGFLEGSNVAPVNEMIRLMEAMRHFETAQRFARGYDDMLRLAISELGRQ